MKGTKYLRIEMSIKAFFQMPSCDIGTETPVLRAGMLLSGVWSFWQLQPRGVGTDTVMKSSARTENSYSNKKKENIRFKLKSF